MVSETKPYDPKAPQRKRKSEIMGVIKGYADELQKKRKLNTASSSEDESNRKFFFASNHDYLNPSFLCGIFHRS